MVAPRYYIPNARMWNWRAVSANFCKYQLERIALSRRHAEQDLKNLDADVVKIEQEIRGKWATANVQMMRAYEFRLKEIRKERKRILWLDMRMNEDENFILEKGSELGWHLA